MEHKAIYPGTFDPITNGHVDIISRAARLFPKLIIAVTSNGNKKPYLPLSTRIALIEEAASALTNVSVLSFDTLLVDFARKQKATVILRGLRAVNDFEYEFQLAGMNRKLAEEIETLFLTPSEQLLFISSSLVREISSLGGDVSSFVPAAVVRALDDRRRQGIYSPQF